MDKSTNIESLFDYILRYSYLLPIITFFLFYKRSGYDRKTIVILTYCILLFATVSVHKYIPKDPSVFFLYQSLFTFLEYLAFALIFLYSIDNRAFKKVIIGSSVGFIIFQVLFTFSANSVHLDSVPVGVETILVFLFIFYFLYQEFRKESQLLVRSEERSCRERV